MMGVANRGQQRTMRNLVETVVEPTRDQCNPPHPMRVLAGKPVPRRHS